MRLNRNAQGPHDRAPHHSLRPKAALLIALVTAMVAGCGGGGGGGFNWPASPGNPPPVAATPPAPVALTCDDSIQAGFKPDASTSVLLVKAFKKGEPLMLGGTATPTTEVAANDVCLVKLLVGPGNPGPVGAPSTSAGIGIEVWLPAKTAWNSRVHAVGGGGWAGGSAGSISTIDSLQAAGIAGTEGAVSSSTDTGHGSTFLDGSFGMNPDGTINKTLWTDFASRGIHEQAVKTKALATAYYGIAPKYSYWEGGSTGGRQGLNLAQNNPDDFDGIIANAPAINWSRFLTAEMWPQIVYQRDLGGVPLTTAQLDLASNAAISACDVVGGQHLGYILDPSACNYDPTSDPKVLCSASGGTNSTPACLTTVQATAVNKIWYGMTADGSVASPLADNGWTGASSPVLLGSGTHRWYGLTRGTSLYLAAQAGLVNGLASPVAPFQVADDQIALELQDPGFADAGFVNATGNGQSLWKSLTYAQVNNAFDRGIALQSSFGNIDTNNPDLTAFKAKGGKMLAWHGLNDELIFPQGTINYYNTVANKMGGLPNVQDFYKLYLVPGMGHGTPNGTSNPAAVVPVVGPTQFYDLLTAWVEKGAAPDAITLAHSSGATRPVCVYPKKVTYTSGDLKVAASYTCS